MAQFFLSIPAAVRKQGADSIQLKYVQNRIRGGGGGQREGGEVNLIFLSTLFSILHFTFFKGTVSQDFLAPSWV